MLESKYTINVIHILRQTGAPLHPSFQWWGNLVPALLGVVAVQQPPPPLPDICPHHTKRHCRLVAFSFLPSQHGQKYLSVSFPHALPISFLSGHSDRLRECSNIKSRNPLAFINSAHYELLSHRESEWGIGNVVFVFRNLKGLTR